MKKTQLLLAAACLLLTCRSSLARGWWTESWTADEKPYRKARIQVDQVRGKQSALLSLVNKWQPLTQGKPFDQLAQYRWGYAFYWLTRARKGEDAHAYQEYGGIREVLQRSTFGDDERTGWRNHSYEFNRLRFWVEQRSDFSFPDLGERLLRRNPNDTETQMVLLKIRLDNCPPQKKTATIALWRKVAARYPNDPITTYWLAEIYNAVYRANHRAYGDPSNARKANELYRRFIKQAPNTSRYQRTRRLAKMFAELNEQAMAQQAKLTPKT